MAELHKARRAIFDEASEIEDLPARQAFLAQACGADDALRREIEELLAADATAGAFLADPRRGDGEAGSQPADVSGERVGRYKLLQKIGEGGCGIVYMAEQVEPVRRRVALKVIKLGMDTRSVIARFEAERQALALMDHPNIAKVLDAGATETGRPFFVMELVRGTRITAYCDQNKLSTADRLKLLVQVCQAIQHAHQKGIIHRDIKPSNILVTVHDGVAVPKVIDFGIAKATTDLRLTDKTLFTQFELFIGTPAYMSPEQADLNASDIDTRSDVYSLGVLLYELLTGRTPFDSEVLLASGLEAMRRTIRETEPVRPSTRLRTLAAADLTQVAAHRRADAPNLVSLVRGDLDWIVLKALEKDRTRRYATANALAMDLERYLVQEPIAARPHTTLYELQKLVRRKKLLFGAAAAIGAAVLGGLGVSSTMYVREQRARVRAVAAESEQGRLRAQEQHLRRESEAANQRLAQALFVRDWQAAETLLEQGKTSSALAWFARAARRPEVDRATVTRLLAILNEHTFAFPATHPLAHSGQVLNAAFSPDGTEVVTAAEDGSVRIWPLREEGPPVTLSNRFNMPVAAFTPFENRLLVLDWNQVSLWQRDGTPIAQRSARLLERRSVSVSADGRYAALPCGQHGPQVWDLNTLQPIGPEFPMEGVELRVLLISPDGRYLIRNSGETGLDAWSVAAGQRVWTAEPPGAVALDPVRSSAISPNGECIAAGYLEGRLVVWKFDPAAGSREAVSSHQAPLLDLRLGLQVTDVCFAPDSRRLYAATLDGMVHVCSLDAGEPLPERIEQETQVNSVRVAPDGHSIVTASANGTAQVWDVRMVLPAARVYTNGHSVYDARYSPDGSWFVMGGSPAAQIRDAETGELRGRLPAGEFVSLVDISPDGRLILAAAGSSALQLWDAREGKPQGTPIALSAQATDLAFSHQGQWFAAGIASGHVALYETKSGTPALPALSQASNPVKIAFSPDDRTLAVVTEAGTVNFWDLPGGTRRGKPGHHKGVIWTVCFSPDGRSVLTASSDHTARVWDTASTELGREFTHEKAVFNAAFSHDHHRVITCSADHTARIWETETGRPVGEPMRHPGDVWYGEFSPDDRFVLTGDDAGNARIWDAASGLPLSGWMHNGRSLKRARLRPDGGQVLTAAVDGSVRVWPVVIPPQPAPLWLPELAEAVAGRRITEEGLVELVPVEGLRRMRTDLSTRPGQDFYARWAKWFLVDRMQQNPSPFRP